MIMNVIAMGVPQGSMGQQGAQPNPMSFFITIFLMFAIIYVLMFLPQQKKQKEHQKMLNEVKKGDEVITSGGIHGIISSLKDDTVIIKIDNNVKVEVTRAHISRVKK